MLQARPESWWSVKTSAGHGESPSEQREENNSKSRRAGPIQLSKEPEFFRK